MSSSDDSPVFRFAKLLQVVFVGLSALGLIIVEVVKVNSPTSLTLMNGFTLIFLLIICVYVNVVYIYPYITFIIWAKNDGTYSCRNVLNIVFRNFVWPVVCIPIPVALNVAFYLTCFELMVKDNYGWIISFLCIYVIIRLFHLSAYLDSSQFNNGPFGSVYSRTSMIGFAAIRIANFFLYRQCERYRAFIDRNQASRRSFFEGIRNRQSP